MRILMYGWELPPFNSGGLGTACKGILEGLMQNNIPVTFVLPSLPKGFNKNDLPSYCLVADAFSSKSSKTEKRTHFSPYISEASYQLLKNSSQKNAKNAEFSKNLIEESQKYAENAELIAENTHHSIIHSHDWLTMPAAIVSKKISHAPMIAHVHSTEFDRSGDNPNPAVYEIEKKGLTKADSIITVSNYTKQKVVDNYGISPDKIKVVYNAIDKNTLARYKPAPIKKTDKIVLFLGRVTLQKGPDYFLDMAKKVLDKKKNVKFIMAGDGDMALSMIRKAINLGIEKHVLFSGFLRGNDVMNAFYNADVYVMPSVSEPFGLTALEAVQNGAPVLVSKQSGVSEVLYNALKIDFWDTDEMANKVISILKYPHLTRTINKHAYSELDKFSWTDVGRQLRDHYNNLTLQYA
jgi:glycosyltransferase involved in cell wall biosynthesis